MSVSQPLPGSPSQSPCIASHEKAHAPLLQYETAPAAEHTLPQTPQRNVSFRRSASQPSAGIPLQSPRPAWHEATRHSPSPHMLVARASAHVAPHAPQFDTVRVDVSQPLVGSPSQSAKPSSQESAHTPP